MIYVLWIGGGIVAWLLLKRSDASTQLQKLQTAPKLDAPENAALTEGAYHVGANVTAPAFGPQENQDGEEVTLPL